MTNGHIRPQIDWSDIDTENVTHVSTPNDLPEPDGGVITLENRVYHFDGFVAAPYTLDISNSPVLLSEHASQGGYIHTAGGTALTGTNGGFFARNCYLHAPGGTLFDISGDQTTEMLVESCGFSDAAGIANIASLGTIDGYRVPTFKGCNFEDFDGGLTFDGNPDKIFIWGSPLRRITASNVTIFTLADTTSAQIVDFADNYIKDVQSDTEVWRVEAGGEPSEVFQYRGTVHDTSVTKDNILVGPNTSPRVVPYWVSDSYPLQESSVVGELSLNGETETVIPSQNTWVQVEGMTTLGNETERMTQSSAGVLQYNGSKDSNVHITIAASVYGANGAIYRVALAKNGTIEGASTMSIQTGGQNANVSISTSSIEDLTPGDTISLQTQNTTGTENVTFAAYTMNALGM